MTPKDSRLKSKVIKIEAQSLRIHPHAQRELVPRKLRQLKKDFDLDAIGVLHGVEYEIDGVLAIWIIDGQHRWKTLIDLGLGEWTVEVKLHLDCKDDARASELFLRLNNRASVHPFDKFENARSAGHADAVGITRLASDRQLKVERGSRDGVVCCVSVLNTVFNIDAGATLAATLDTVLAAWGRTAAAVEGRVIEGLGLVYERFNGAIDRPALVKKLAKYPGGPSKLIGDARGLREFRHASIPRCLAERVIEVYNAGRRAGKLDPL
jgi:hypothetical protein